MAARINRRHQEMVKDKIRASQLINRLENHVLEGGECLLRPEQVTAALGLLKKIVPDVKAIEHSGPEGGPIEYSKGEIAVVHTTPDDTAETGTDSD